ncbi:MAG: Rhodanese-like domain protein [Chloroflexi bacterium AL-N10]|nr:Rhodanese-like domain protein [Chloroflexi bacterium AL-N1]NOK67533.1 Rhodanese-like domain protein [Chloroflexi bacterium AL-N10]NOK75696.1 Rhodanese-like domain protein [Chloroflexi bacterium AL-N5]NOK90329.1 Rhodanese-like domain protein [Chloroflexi bacterium AL-N15]
MTDDYNIELNKTVVKRLLGEVFNGRNLDLLPEILTSDFVLNPLAAFPPEKEHGPEGMRRLYEGFFVGIPDVKAETLTMVAEGNTVMVYDRFGGTHDGQLGPFAPTGKQLFWNVMHLYRIRNGKIAEDNVLVDALGLMRQVGAISD